MLKGPAPRAAKDSGIGFDAFTGLSNFGTGETKDWAVFAIGGVVPRAEILRVSNAVLDCGNGSIIGLARKANHRFDGSMSKLKK